LKNQHKNIEALFKDSFDGFEADVSDKTWSNIQKGINKPSGTQFKTPDSSSFFGKLNAASWVAATASFVGIATIVAIWINSSNDYSESLVKIENTTLQQKEKDAHPLDITDGKDKESKHTDISDTHWETSSGNTGYDNGTETNTGNSKDDVSSTGNSENVKPLINNEEYYKSSPTNQNDEHGQKTTERKTPTEKDIEPTIKPVADISVSLDEGYAPLTVDFYSYNLGDNVEWDFGDGSSSFESNPSHIYSEHGDYKVKLKVKDQGGKEVSNTITIKVRAENASRIYPIPNVITPNGDGNNEIFIIPSENLKVLLVSIYSVHQKKVNEINEPDGSWNGTDFSGVRLPNGTYYYTLHAEGIDGETYVKTGNITIIR